MLEDLSAHVLDISENSTMAGADEVEITIKEDEREDLLLFSVKDNGRGMSPEFVAKVTDPFTTTRTTRRVGMGLPFLRQSAELCGGGLVIDSTVGVGTTITATFQYGRPASAGGYAGDCHDAGYGLAQRPLAIPPHHQRTRIPARHRRNSRGA